MKNPIVLQIISNTIINYDNELKIASSWDCSKEVEQGDKNKWTSEAQRLKMFELFYIENLPRSEIAQKLCVSYSTVYRVIRYSELFPKTISSLFRLLNVKLHKWAKAQQKIVKYIKAQSGVFISTSLKHYIETETVITICKQSKASFLRSSLGLSYKRVASRLTKSNIPETKLKKIIFWLEFANLIKPEHILLNIDETLFSKSTKINYSWTMKGVEASVTNSTLIGSLSLLAAITNRGDWYISNLLSRNNSDNFISYIGKLLNWVQNGLCIEAFRVVLIMDNCRIHTSTKTKQYLSSLGWRVLILSPYSPEFAPIELLFNHLKQKLAMHWKDLIVDLKKKEGFKQIKEWMAAIKRSNIISFMTLSFKSISDTIK